MNFEFSVIMTIYNVETYLDEAIESVINQTIGFDNIELILVNDGSQDSCSDICKKYKALYPDNVVYIEKENEGISASRNQGIDVAHGKFFNFLDGDDKLALDACEKVLKFAQKNKEIDVIAVPMILFENEKKDHELNDKFSSTRVIDLWKETEIIQESVSSTFIRRDSALQYRFDLNLKYGENLLFVNSILIQSMKIGVISDTCYWFRIRSAGTAALQSAENTWDYYLPYVKNCYRNLIDASKEKYNIIPRWLQNTLVYDIKKHVCVQDVPNNVFCEGEDKNYEKGIASILEEIDIDIIRYHKFLSWEDKVYLFELKSGFRLKERLECVYDKNDVYCVLDSQIIEKLSNVRMWIQDIVIKDNKIQIESIMSNRFLGDDFKSILIVQTPNGDEKKYPLEIVDGWRKDNFRWGNNLNDTMYFKCKDIEYVSGMTLRVQILKHDVSVFAKIGFDGMYKYLTMIADSYRILNSNYVVWEKNNMVNISDIDKELLYIREKEFLKSLQKNNYYQDIYQEVKERRKRALEWRIKPNRKKIWLFTDRVNMADDNAEHLFKFCRKHEDELKDVDMYFMLEKESPHFKRMQQYGTIIDFFSDESKELYLKADMVISSQASFYTYCPFELNKEQDVYMTFLNAKRIFLQHGIIKGDMSGWLHKWNKHIDFFETASPYEYDSIAHGKYHYTDEIQLTGMPRFDGLVDQKEKIILFMPTWNSKYALYNSNMEQVYNALFKESDLYKEINGVLTSEKLEKVMKKYGYRLLFKPHPNMMVQLPDFKTNELTMVVGQDVSYQELYKKGAMLITDFSSAEFDFAYMKKPIVYLQVRDHHIIEGYYDYQNMAFGEVVNSLDNLIDRVIKYLENGCRMEEKYQERVTKFYAYTDRNNCRRIMDILKGM